MSSRRFVLLATTSVAAFCAFGGPVHAALATTPPAPPSTTQESTASTAGDSQVPADPATSGEIVEEWALTPAASADPDEAGNRSEFAYVVEPGTELEDAVTVFNSGNVSEDFRIYATDAFNNDQGQFDILPGEQDPTGVGSWVTIPQERITVPPGKQATIPIKIKIPLEAAAGDHAGAIVASSPTSGSDAEGNVLNLDRRTGSRIYIRVNGLLRAGLAVTDVSTTYDQSVNPLGGTAHVRYHVENRGNVRLGGTLTASVAGPFGIGETKIALPEMPELLPGEDVTLTADVEDVPTLMLGATTVRLTPSDGLGIETNASESKDTSFVPPIPLLLALFIAIIGLLVWRAVQRRRRAGEPDTTADREIEPQPDIELEPQYT
jgi:WxL interacting protein linking bacterial and host surfaces